jgi:hypothetical protein
MSQALIGFGVAVACMAMFTNFSIHKIEEGKFVVFFLIA